MHSSNITLWDTCAKMKYEQFLIWLPLYFSVCTIFITSILQYVECYYCRIYNNTIIIIIHTVYRNKKINKMNMFLNTWGGCSIKFLALSWYFLCSDIYFWRNKNMFEIGIFGSKKKILGMGWFYKCCVLLLVI